MSYFINIILILYTVLRVFCLYLEFDLTIIQCTVDILRFFLVSAIAAYIGIISKHPYKHVSYLTFLLALWDISLYYFYHFQTYRYVELLRALRYPVNKNDVDALQTLFQCCGLTSYKEYANWGLSVPMSCMRNDEATDFYEQGCLPQLAKSLSVRKLNLYCSVAFSFMMYVLHQIQLIGDKSKKQKRSYIHDAASGNSSASDKNFESYSESKDVLSLLLTQKKWDTNLC